MTFMCAVISNVLAGRRQSVFERQAALGRDGHVHEEIDVVPDVPLRQSVLLVLGNRQHVAIAAGVHRLLFERIAYRVAFRRAGAADRIVTPTVSAVIVNIGRQRSERRTVPAVR